MQLAVYLNKNIMKCLFIKIIFCDKKNFIDFLTDKSLKLINFFKYIAN
jgi:hypothetical protein